jgi:hypothetical protein
MSLAHPRLLREERTVAAMIKRYCRGQHGPGAELCPDCQALRDYVRIRLERCPFQEEKSTCVNCPVHCYQAAQREKIKAVMRYAGPRMLWQHPVLALRHWLDGKRKAKQPRPLGG